MASETVTRDGEDNVAALDSTTLQPTAPSTIFDAEASCCGKTNSTDATSDQTSLRIFNESNCMRRRRGMQVKLNKDEISSLEVLNVRNRMTNCPPGGTNSLFLQSVLCCCVRDVDIMLSLTKLGQIHGLDKNCEDSGQRSALTIAIDNRDVAMMTTLLSHDVEIGMSLFDAVSGDFFEGVEILLEHGDFKTSEITKENNHFQIGITPMLLAAHRNNYKILALLYKCGHRLEESEQYTDMNESWECANKRKMVCKARAQPAYITLVCETTNQNPMEFCLAEIRKLKSFAKAAPEIGRFYEDCIEVIEGFMCSLLDQICSSKELSELFHYDLMDENFRGERKLHLLEQAGKERLVRFVTHPQSQFAISHLRFRSAKFKAKSTLQTTVLQILSGIWFPVLSLFYMVAPDSKLGRLLTLPDVCFACYMGSDIMFAVLLLLNIALKTVDSGRLGAPPSVIDILIVLWVLGKWLQEIRECILQGARAYLSSMWNFIDVAMLSLFQAGIIVRTVDYFKNRDIKDTPKRLEWDHYELRLVAEALFALAYALVFVRLTSIMRVSRYFGPLHISLSRMIADVCRFMLIYLLIMCAFALAFCELYWYYGTDEASKIFCHESKKNEMGTCEVKVGFTTIPKAIRTLFWANFGEIDVDSTAILNGKHLLTQGTGRFLLVFYHIVAVIVLINMLIAMMSKSYETTSENEEIQYMFHRTSVWIHYSRREMTRPPPMNLIPNPRGMIGLMQTLKKFLTRQKKQEATQTRPQRRHRLTTASRTLKEGTVQSILVRRYKLKHLIKKNNCV